VLQQGKWKKRIAYFEGAPVGQIEWTDVEDSPLPLKGRGLSAVSCLWVLRDHVHRSLGDALLAVAEQEGRDGLCTLAYDDFLPWMQKVWWQQRGFAIAEEAPSGRMREGKPITAFLLWKAISRKAKRPRIDRARLARRVSYCAGYPWLADPVVPGVRWGAAAAAIKKQGRLDVGVLHVDGPHPACAAIFTKCEAPAAPVVVSRPRAKSGRARALVVNSGCANAATGERGLDDAWQSAREAAKLLGGKPEEVMVASTGVIGAFLPMDRLSAGLREAARTATAYRLPDFARAIMTTDTVPKASFRTASIGGAEVTVAGCCKGAGMIMPDMATLLGFLATDARAEAPLLRRALAAAARDSFNALTVDGDTSTNDSLFLFASGSAGNKLLRGADERAFTALLTEVCRDLARAVARDGEGATKLIEVRVDGARSFDEADRIARRIANSPLVKTAAHAADPNWGRIVAAAGTAGVKLDPRRLAVRIGDAEVYRGGTATTPEAESAAGGAMRASEFTITVSLGLGKASRTIYTCDLSAQYVKINAEYRT
jgi:glutamate N-acetyltransferase/amino-acid N-acetyltransferase